MAHNPYHNRFRWWYEAIADLMIAHPDWSQRQIADALSKHPNTIGYIISADTFKAYYARRRADYKGKIEERILSKTADIAALGLDLIHENMEKKRATIPMDMLVRTTGDALDRLGFGAKPAAPLVQVNNTNIDQRNVQLPAITQHELLEAQEALRKSQRAQLVEHDDLPKLTSPSLELEDLNDPIESVERE